MAPERVQKRFGEVRGASEHRSTRMGPGGAFGAQEHEQPPQEAGDALPRVEGGGECGVKLGRLRGRVRAHTASRQAQRQLVYD